MMVKIQRSQKASKGLKKNRDVSLAARWSSTLLNSFQTRSMSITEADIHLVDFDRNTGNIKWASLPETFTESEKALLAGIFHPGCVRLVRKVLPPYMIAKFLSQV